MQLATAHALQLGQLNANASVLTGKLAAQTAPELAHIIARLGFGVVSSLEQETAFSRGNTMSKRYVFSSSPDSSSVLGRRVYSHHQQCGYSLQTRLRGIAHAACSWQEICFQEM